jgi:hypothetical protein
MDIKKVLGVRAWNALAAPSVLEIRNATVATLHERLSAVEASPRDSFIARIVSCLGSRAVTSIEEQRIALVKLAIARLPESLPSIEAIILGESEEFDPEVLFSFFCFLDEVPDLPVDAGVENKICRMVVSYLRAAKSNAAQAPWMAGDLLGAHWPPSSGVDALCNLAKTARYVVGRSAAIHGLSHALEAAPGYREAIMSVLAQVSRDDRSESVRLFAQAVFEGKRF